jgi:hypothetical protein
MRKPHLLRSFAIYGRHKVSSGMREGAMTSASLTPRLGSCCPPRQVNIVLTAPRSVISEAQAD